MSYILSVDLGTTALKIALFNEEGRIFALSRKEYQLLTPDALSVELDVETYWTEFRNGLTEILNSTDVDKNKIIAIGISAQGETLIILDENNKPLRRAIVWLDNRAQDEAEILENEFGDYNSYKITGQVKIVPTWPASKIYWIKRHEKDIFKKVYKFLLIEDYFIHRLTGKFIAEGSLLCSTVYWNINTKLWWKEMIDYLGISI